MTSPQHAAFTVLFALIGLFGGMYLGRESSPVTNLGECYPVIARQHHAPSAGYEIRKIEGFTLYSCKDSTK